METIQTLNEWMPIISKIGIVLLAMWALRIAIHVGRQLYLVGRYVFLVLKWIICGIVFIVTLTIGLVGVARAWLVKLKEWSSTDDRQIKTCINPE